MLSAAAGMDRGRVRERLQAALAGLQELRLLRDRHGDMVSWALQLDREEPVTALHADPMEEEEQRLEATLTALKQQLVGTVTLAPHHKLMFAAGALLMRALASPTLYGQQASILAAAGSEQTLQEQIRHDRDRCQQKPSPVDPKFQRNLESCGGAEVYQYPSPLHAVALQSPIYFTGGEDGTSALLEGHGALLNGYDSLQMGYKNKTQGYIDKLLQRNLSKSQISPGAETVETQDSYHWKLAENVNMPFEMSPKLESSCIPPQAKTKNVPVSRDHCMVYSSQEPNERKSHKSLRAPEIHCRYSYHAAMKEYSSNEGAYSTLKRNDRPQTDNAGLPKNHSDENCGDDREMRKGHWQRPVVAHTSSTEESPNLEVQSTHTSSPEFVHAKFVPASSQRFKVRQADRKTKALKLKRKSSDKPRVLRQQHSFSSGERTKEVSVGAKGEERRSGKGKVNETGGTWQTQEHRQRSGSDSSLYSPGLKITHKVHPKPHPVLASKLSKNRKPQCMEYEHPVEQRKRRQATPKWQSDVDIYQAPFVQHRRSKEQHARALENTPMVRNISAKPGHWIRPSHPFHFSMSSNSFLQSLNIRYPPAPFHMTSHYPPRCESEYSAECASLFHSTIAESSEGEMSDNTTNRFGDTGQPNRQLPPRPEPSACRIKASRALKKKIRRFQPASLKVMTLV
ncbi:hypothetical protein GOODEAATRI_014365 [Goodea atripinnis]|uniref:Dapper homolog 2 n=1 Tax=Goodea atripinnis TaxID=208336 RepID=A0ABV0PXZ7_9TELE